jgi:hypothetical protein
VKTKRRTEISLETRRYLVIRSRGGSIQSWCADCDKAVRMVTPDKQLILSHVSSARHIRGLRLSCCSSGLRVVVDTLRGSFGWGQAPLSVP